MTRVSSPLARNLEALNSLLWSLFLVWSAVVATLWIGLLGETQITESIANIGLRRAIIFLVQIADPVWLTLAAAVVYLHVVEAEGLSTARRWALVIFAVSGAIAVCSAWYSVPLGPVRYTTRLGMKLGPVPFGWPLLWFVAIAGARHLAAELLARPRPVPLALLAGAIAAVTSLNLEPIARLRAFWLWLPPDRSAPTHAPLENYLTWLAAGALSAWLMRAERVVPRVTAQRWRPALVLGILNLLCLATHLRLSIRG